MRPLHHELTVKVELRFQRRDCTGEPLILLCQPEERQDVYVVEQVIAQERVLDLPEESADPPVARTDWSACHPMTEQELDRIVDRRDAEAK